MKVKKFISMLLALLMLLTSSVVLAEGMGVQVIGGSEIETGSVSLDDLKLEAETEIENYAIFKPLSFGWKNTIAYINPGVIQSSLDSGSDAEYACLVMDITNMQFSSKDFLANCTVKAIFDDEYQYEGWFYQYAKDSSKILIDSADGFSIDPLYAGHYVFGCTLPNFVVNSDKPLSVIITIDDKELIYNARQWDSSIVTSADMGVQVISEPTVSEEPVSLDDLQIEREAVIENSALFKPLRFEWKNELAYINPGVIQSSFSSGNDADYACLITDITNTQFVSKNFLTNCSVKVVYDDKYEYAGWAYQYQKESTRVLSDSSDCFSIGPLYVGHYVFGCTLPNMIVNSDKSLAMIITIGGDELIYNIRK